MSRTDSQRRSSKQDGHHLAMTVDRMESLRRSRSTQEVLSWLLVQLRCWGFSTVRYYHYDDTLKRIVSIDSAGMPDSVAQALRYGAIIRFRRSTPLKSNDSFWCFSKMEPILFAVDKKKARKPLSPVTILSGVQLIYLHSDHCRQELEGCKESKWVDYPLIVANKCIGKLSCDLVPPARLTSRLRSAIHHVLGLAHLVAPILEFLHSESLMPLATIREEIASCTSLQSLFKCCTETLARRYFNCKHASIFTFNQDLFGSSKLILRKTSFKKLQSQENKAFYDLDEETLTTWVVRHGESVRLHSLKEHTALQEQLKAYGRGIKWRNKFTDSKVHTTFLAVPLGTKSEPQGVLRYTEKRAGRFSESDQILLERVTQDYIGPRLQMLAHSEFICDVVREIQAVHAISLRFTSRQATPNELCIALERCFPQSKANKKLYLINLLDEDGTHFRHYAIGGELQADTISQERYPLVGSFTKHIMDSSADTAVLVNDLMAAESSGRFHAICPTALCALGSPLVFRGRPFGALVVMSEHYDLLEASHRNFLAILAGEASQLFGLKQVLDVSSGLLGMRHDCAALLNQIINLVETQPTAWKEEAVTLVRFLLETVNTYCRPLTRNPAIFAAYECIETKVREEVALAATAVKHEMGRVSGMDCKIDGDLVAVVQPSYLMNIVYNLLKNAWGAMPVNGPPILVTANIVEGYLEVSIMDRGPGIPDSALNEYNSPDALRMLTIGLPHQRVKGLGLLVAQRIAGWHALPDGRTGEVRLCPGEGGTGIRAVIKLPIVERVNGNELKGPKET